jgi:hypothetical protein
MVSLYNVKHQGSGSKHKTREQSGFSQASRLN